MIKNDKNDNRKSSNGGVIVIQAMTFLTFLFMLSAITTFCSKNKCQLLKMSEMLNYLPVQTFVIGKSKWSYFSLS